MRRLSAVLAALVVTMLPAFGRADCTSSGAQAIARHGYEDLARQRFNQARLDAAALATYARSCPDAAVGYPSVVHSAYIGALALHGLGQDARAAKAVDMGMHMLQVLHAQGRFEDLYSALLPKFEDLRAHLHL